MRAGGCDCKRTTARLGQQAVSFLRFYHRNGVCSLSFNGM
nr:MAG TPA: hypothetical protein [Caudoviricetes sp.]